MDKLLLSLTLVSCYLVLPCWTKSVGDYREKEVECYTQSKVYHRGTDQCYKLLTRGPCQEGFWFVLEKPERGRLGKYSDYKINAICVEEKCPDGGYYWTNTKTCVLPKDKKHLCANSTDEELLNNYFGEAECVCGRDPPRARLNGDTRNRCHKLYTQGPCRQGQVLGFSRDDLENAICIEDRCYQEKVKRRKENRVQHGILAPWKDGSCYELGTQGPCEETLKFKIDETTYQPNCITLTNAIFDLAKPQKCYQDENGDCQKRIDPAKVQNSDKFKEELLSALAAARKKRENK